MVCQMKKADCLCKYSNKNTLYLTNITIFNSWYEINDIFFAKNYNKYN